MAKLKVTSMAVDGTTWELFHKKYGKNTGARLREMIMEDLSHGMTPSHTPNP